MCPDDQRLVPIDAPAQLTVPPSMLLSIRTGPANGPAQNTEFVKPDPMLPITRLRPVGIDPPEKPSSAIPASVVPAGDSTRLPSNAFWSHAVPIEAHEMA